jgi:uncharacterized membrane protein
VAGAGNATLSVTTLATAAAGTYNLTVTATSGSLAHTFPVTLVVQPSPDFGLVASPASVTVSRGGSAVYTLSASALGGFVGKVSLAVTGLPAHSSSTFSVNPVTVPGKSKLTVKTTTKTARGTYLLTVKGTSGSKVHQVTVTLVVR